MFMPELQIFRRNSNFIEYGIFPFIKVEHVLPRATSPMDNGHIRGPAEYALCLLKNMNIRATTLYCPGTPGKANRYFRPEDNEPENKKHNKILFLEGYNIYPLIFKPTFYKQKASAQKKKANK